MMQLCVNSPLSISLTYLAWITGNRTETTSINGHTYYGEGRRPDVCACGTPIRYVRVEHHLLPSVTEEAVCVP